MLSIVQTLRKRVRILCKYMVFLTQHEQAVVVCSYVLWAPDNAILMIESKYKKVEMELKCIWRVWVKYSQSHELYGQGLNGEAVGAAGQPLRSGPARLKAAACQLSPVCCRGSSSSATWSPPHSVCGVSLDFAITRGCLQFVCILLRQALPLSPEWPYTLGPSDLPAWAGTTDYNKNNQSTLIIFRGPRELFSFRRGLCVAS